MTRGGNALVEAGLRRMGAVEEGEGPSEAAVERGVRAVVGAMRAAPAPGRPWVAVFGAQMRLFSPAFRLAAVIVLLLGLPEAFLPTGSARSLLDLVAPALAAAGVLVAFGGVRRASLEVELACMVRPYELLLARLLLVVASDLGMALLATAVLMVEGRGGAVAHLVLGWLGPLLLLAGVNLSLAVRWGAALAAVPTAALWGIVTMATTRVHWSALSWFALGHMPTSELAVAAGIGLMLLAWTVARGSRWVQPGGHAL